MVAEFKGTTAYNYTPGQSKTPHGWLDIVEDEKRRCMRAGARPHASGKPVIPQRALKEELSRWLASKRILVSTSLTVNYRDDMYRQAAQVREWDTRNLHEIVLDLNCSMLQNKKVTDVDTES